MCESCPFRQGQPRKDVLAQIYLVPEGFGPWQPGMCHEKTEESCCGITDKEHEAYMQESNTRWTKMKAYEKMSELDSAELQVRPATDSRSVSV